MERKILWIGLLLLFLQASANAQTGQMVPPPSADNPVPPFSPPVTRPFSSPRTLSGAPGGTPEECGSEGFIFQNGQLILGVSRVNPPLYMVKNTSDYEQLLVSHPTNTAMSAHWESRLDQGQWSALAMSQPNFVLNCFGRKPGVAAYVDCKSVLSICSISNAKVSGGTHWMSENEPISDTLSSLRTKNVTLPK